MIIKIMFQGEYDYDYVSCPDNVEFRIPEFDEWIASDRTHPFWEYEDGELMGLCYRGDAVVYYINNCLCKYSDEKSYVIDSFSDKKIDYDLLIRL